MSPRRAFWAIVFLACVVAAGAAEPEPELIHAEKTLKDAGIDTTGPALLRFFRERTQSPADRARLADMVRRLGDDDFDVREKAVADLIGAGHRAMPFLRPALVDRDLERARRAADCVREIEKAEGALWEVAAARVLADRRPDGATAVLLAYLPCDDEGAEDAVLRALLVLGVKDGTPDAALVQAMADTDPLRRAAAAHVLGRAAPGQRAAVRRLLADGDARVRLEAAEALVHAGDREAVPALIALLGDGRMTHAYRAQELLYRLAGEKAPPAELTDDDPARRAAVAGVWRRWWKDAEPATDLAAINLDQRLRGVNVLAEPDGPERGRVWACRTDGQPLWTFALKGGPVDVQLLPNGHVLVAEWSDQEVTERDRAGNIVWTKKVDNYPTTCRRLPSGNTFIATLDELLEVDPTGKTLHSVKNPVGRAIYRAHRLPNRHFLIACEGDRIVELDARGKQVRAITLPTGANAWMGVEPLPGDRFLVAVRGADKVMEIDTAGRVFWEIDAPDPRSAVRLPNGNTLVSCYTPKFVLEFDRTGKLVWKLKTGNVCCVRRY
jgi:hypothetical protein